MRIGYGRPEDPVTNLVGTGAAFLNDDGAATLFDDSPQSVAQIQWLSAGSPAITDYVEFQITWTTPQVMQNFGLLIPTLSDAFALPVGVKVVVLGQQAFGLFDYDLGGNSQTVRVREMPNETHAALVAFDTDLNAITGIAIRVYNDIDGEAWADSSTIFSLGEAVVQSAVEVPLAQGWTWRWQDPTVRRRSLTAQRSVTPRTPYRVQKLPGIAEHEDKHFRAGLTNGINYQRLNYQLLQDNTSLVFPYYLDENNELDEELLHETGVFCELSPAESAHFGGQYSVPGWDAEEIPS